MSYSINSYVASGSQAQFAVTFPYLDKTHVEVRLNSVLTTAYTWASSGVIQLNTTPASGVVVDIRRNTPKTARLVDFQDASTLIERDLDNDSNQMFYLSQEAFDAVLNNVSLDTDGLFNAQNKRIKNVADPVNAQDAVTKNWAETAMSSQLAQATAKATAAASSETNAASSATAAAASATSSAASASTSTTQAGISTTKASEASSSAASALTSKNAAAVSEANAATSATQAASSASAASGSASSANTSAVGAAASATTATTKASEASSSATSASGSAATATTKASDASNSASSAATSATNAAASAATASTKAGEASASATSASGSATTATTKASEASASATTATTQADIATTKASESAASAVSAASSAASAASLLDNFDDRYLGSKSAAPTVDNDGNALLIGALYFDSTTGKMRTYTSAGWIDASSASVATLAVFNYTATAGQTTFSGNDVAGVSLTYTVGAVIVTLNGIDLKNGVDFTASNGSSVVLASGAAVGDELRVYAFGNFQVADTYSQAAADARFLKKNGDDNVYVSGNKVGVGTNAPTARLTTRAIDQSYTNSALSVESYTGAYKTCLTQANSTFYISNGGVNDHIVLDGSGRVTMPYQPAFSAYGTQISLPSNSTVVANVTDVNTGSHYSTSTGRFTAPVAGRYHFVGTLDFNGATVGGYYGFQFNQNGVSKGQGIWTSPSTVNDNSVTQSIILNLAAGDYVTMHTVYANTPYITYSNFSGFLIG